MRNRKAVGISQECGIPTACFKDMGGKGSISTLLHNRKRPGTSSSVFLFGGDKRDRTAGGVGRFASAAAVPLTGYFIARGQRFSLSFRQSKKHTRRCVFCFGGDKRDRTADLLNAIQALSQLSYTPIFCCRIAADLHNIAGKRKNVNPYFSKNPYFFQMPPALPRRTCATGRQTAFQRNSLRYSFCSGVMRKLSTAFWMVLRWIHSGKRRRSI